MSTAFPIRFPVKNKSRIPKPSLKIGTENVICWNSLDLFRDYGLNYIFFRNKTFCFQYRKLKLSASVWKRISWNLTKFELIQLIHKNFSIGCLIELWGFAKFYRPRKIAPADDALLSQFSDTVLRLPMPVQNVTLFWETTKKYLWVIQHVTIEFRIMEIGTMIIKIIYFKYLILVMFLKKGQLPSHYVWIKT